LLANPHYPHLREALRAIDAVIASGLSLKELRGSTMRGEFGSHLADALLIDHFLSRGLTPAKTSSRQGGKNPDVDLRSNGFTATVEVYSPRGWQWRDDWLGDVTDTLKNADIAYEYAATMNVAVVGLPADVDLVEDMILRTGADVLRRLRCDLATLDETATGSTWRYEHIGGELVTMIRFAHVAQNETGMVRSISSGEPGETFDANDRFRELVDKIRGKAAKRQTERGRGSLRGLAVDASRTGIDDLLAMGRLKLKASVGLDLDHLGLDFIALTLPRRGILGPCRGVRADVLFEDTRITQEDLGRLFDLYP
jgi:hypothetical protein